MENTLDTKEQAHGMPAITEDNLIVQAFIKLYKPAKSVLSAFIKQLEETAKNLPSGGRNMKMFNEAEITKVQSTAALRVFSKIWKETEK